MREETPSHVPLSALAELNPKTPLPPATDCSFVGMEDVSESGRLTRTRRRSSNEAAAGYTTFREGDVLFAKITPCMENGKGALAEGLHGGFGFGSTEFHVLRARPGVDPRFIAHWCQTRHLRSRAEAMMTGSAGQRRVPAQFFDRFKVLGFTLTEQQRIVAILDSVDESIRSTESAIFKQKKLGDAILLKFFHSFESDGTLSVLASLGDGTSPVLKIGPFGSSLKGSDWTTSGVPVITIGSLNLGRISTDELLYISRSKASALSAYQVRAGDIVFSRVADVGRSVVIQQEQEGWVMSSNLLRISVDRRVVRPEFVQLSLAYSPLIRRQLRATTNSGGRDVTSAGIIAALTVHVPPLTRQDALCDAWEGIMASISADEARLAKLRSLKHSLTDDLLTGQVRAKVGEG